MDTDRKWVVVRIDGKIAAVSTDYKALAGITARIAQQKTPAYGKVCAETVDFDHVWNLRNTARWENLMLFGTDFQKKVWKKLYELTHPEEAVQEAAQDGTEGEGSAAKKARLISYSDFADLCQNKAGVRAVAHAIGLNPISVIIPCHLVIPKESIDKMADIRRKAESTIFKGEDICVESFLHDKSVDFGEYALGRGLKRRLIQLELV